MDISRRALRSFRACPWLLAAVLAVLPPAALAAPGSYLAQDATSSGAPGVLVCWQSVGEEDTMLYRLSRADVSAGPYVVLDGWVEARGGGSTYQVTDASVPPGTLPWYSIREYFMNGLYQVWPPTETDALPPDQGNTLRAIRLGTDVSLTWTGSGVSRWSMYRDAAKDQLGATALPPIVSVESYLDRGRVPLAGSDYYRVRGLPICRDTPGP